MNVEPINPCPHMKVWLSASLDGALSRLALWYTQWHVTHCPRCQAALAALRALRDSLRALSAAPSRSALTPDRWRMVEAAWAEAESRAG